MCVNVDQAGRKGGQNTCFKDDEIGMECGWDGTKDEAYCTPDTTGVLVCARAKGGGKCEKGDVPPPTKMTASEQAKKAQLQKEHTEREEKEKHGRHDHREL